MSLSNIKSTYDGPSKKATAYDYTGEELEKQLCQDNKEVSITGLKLLPFLCLLEH